ncbi:hypothetical protein [Haloflavibacter putidus]|uniref:Uncharacterized protein n=1 Tax=Haloflavibacter putidus TaxID=2576776 RepID=A0A507ZGH5_9FLAO|nr:hypothetical protein [Haloflavibacter putidus]TQD36249.1 hypothetical protein FKR84_10575 [Haloflavibacter putidus]
MIKKLNLGEIINEYQEYFSEKEIVELKQIQQSSGTLAAKAKALHAVLFSEETDFMLDSSSDAKDRSRGINPMSAEYTKRMNSKREAFGIEPLSVDGYAVCGKSEPFCEEVIRQDKNYKEFLEAKEAGESK